MFISILYMFRAAPYSSSGESIVSIQHLVCRWPSSMQVGKEELLPDLHTRRSRTQCEILQIYWYNWFSWCWARGCPKHVEKWNERIRKNNCEPSWLYLQELYQYARSAEHQINPYPTAFPYGNGMVLHFYQQQDSSTTKTVHKVINKGLKTYV